MLFPINSAINVRKSLNNKELPSRNSAETVKNAEGKENLRENSFASFLEKENAEKEKEKEFNANSKDILNDFLNLLSPYFNIQAQNHENILPDENNNLAAESNNGVKNEKIPSLTHNENPLKYLLNLNGKIEDKDFLTDTKAEFLQKMNSFFEQSKSMEQEALSADFEKDTINQTKDLDNMKNFWMQAPLKGGKNLASEEGLLLEQQKQVFTQIPLRHAEDLDIVKVINTAPSVNTFEDNETLLLTLQDQLRSEQNLLLSQQKLSLNQTTLNNIKDLNNIKGFLVENSSSLINREDNKKIEAFLSALQDQPRSEQIRILQSLLSEKTSHELFIDPLKTNKDLAIKLQNDLAREDGKNNEIKYENLDIEKTSPQIFLENNQEPIQKFTEPKKNDKQTEEHSESYVLLGNNGESFSHSDVKRANLLPVQANADAAINKAIDLSDQLKATQGGRAKFQIQDSNLGMISLQIDMKNKNSVNIFIQTEHEEVKKQIEDKVDFLKQSLDSQKITITDFKVALIDKSSSSQFNHSNQQGQNPQNFNQNTNLQHNFNNNYNQSSNGENNSQLIFDENIAKGTSNKNYKNVQKNSITNIQRSANGSIKVLA